MSITSTWHNVKMTIAEDNTPQAPSDADLVTAGVLGSHATTMIATVVSEFGNDATNPARIGGPIVSATGKTGLPLRPSAERQVNSRNRFDIRGVYTSAKAGDVFNYAWEG